MPSAQAAMEAQSGLTFAGLECSAQVGAKNALQRSSVVSCPRACGAEPLYLAVVAIEAWPS